MRRLIFIFGLTVVGCNDTQMKEVLPFVPAAKLQKTGFVEIRNEVLATNCLECHKWTNDYQTVKRRAPGIRDAVLSGRMPKGKAFDVNQKALLIAWIDAGAPELPGQGKPTDPVKPGEPDPTLPVDGAEYSFAQIHNTILVPYCLDCHTDPDEDNEFTTLNTYVEVTKFIKDVEKEVSRGKMPPQKSDIQMPTEEREKLLQWIEAGAPEFGKQ